MNRLLLGALCLAGQAAAGEVPRAADPVDAPALERLVRQDCGSCHGLTLKGGLGPDIRTRALAKYDHESLSEVILDGIPGTAMPPWRPLLSPAEVDWIVTYLLTGESE